MKILITGVAGLLGSRLADWILENTDNEVIGVDDLSGGYIENVNPKVKFYKFDLVDLNEVEGVFKNEQPDIVYHFAAFSDINKSINDPVKSMNINVNGTLKLIDLVFRLLFVEF